VINEEGVPIGAGAMDSNRSGEREDTPKATDCIVAARKTLKTGQPVVNPMTPPCARAANF